MRPNGRAKSPKFGEARDSPKKNPDLPKQIGVDEK